MRPPSERSGNRRTGAAGSPAAASVSAGRAVLRSSRRLAFTQRIRLTMLLVLRSAKKAAPRRVPIALPADLTELGGPRHALSAGAIDVGDDDRVLVGVGAHNASGFDSIPTPNLPAAAVANSDIVQLIERQPDEVAQLLRSWLADRRD